MARVIAHIGDLLFKSKVLETARQLGVEVALNPADDWRADLFIVDLNAKPMELVKAIRSRASAPIVAFVGHTRTEVMKEASELGVQVMTNGGFSAQLPSLLEFKAP